MDNQALLEPMKFYDTIGKKQHEQNVIDYFDNLVKRSNVDVELNKKSVKDYNKQVGITEHLNDKIKKHKVLRGFLIFFAVVGFCLALFGLMMLFNSEGPETWVKVLLFVGGLVVGIAMILIITMRVNKAIKLHTDAYNDELNKANELLALCQKQMHPLNALFTEMDTFNIIEKTLPVVKFNRNFDMDLAEDFQKNYDFIDLMNENRSVIDTVSGRLFKNPFVFYRYRNHYMGNKEYTGSLTIHWTTIESDGDGGTRTVDHTQTLFASVVKPYPYYNLGTGLNYGCQSAPDLNFSREYKHAEDYSEKKLARKIKSGEKKLQQKAEDAIEKGGSFTEMGNTQFDVLFGAHDRDHEVQFRMMFSPLAQNNMVDILLSQTGYGDDFMFTKRGRFNFIESEHAQGWVMDTSPIHYYSYDIEQIRRNFIEFNNTYFKSVFFDFAPLLAIPTYQQEPSKTFEPIEHDMGNYNYYEHEALANAMGVENFQHIDTATEVILKAKYLQSRNKTDCVQIKAESYSATNRIDFVPVYGGDGYVHEVPVPWIEYQPVERYTNIAVKKLDVDRKEFDERKGKEENGGLFNAPNAFMHGLFAKIIGDDDIDIFDKTLEKF